MKIEHFIGPNRDLDGCVNHLQGYQMRCEGCLANKFAFAKSEKICSIIASGDKSLADQSRRRVNKRVDRLIEMNYMNIEN